MKIYPFEAMLLRWILPFLLAILLFRCSLHNERFLDPSIPRVVTPPAQIAIVRTKWVNGKLWQTTFLDKQDRILEDFVYGRSNEKTLNQYMGDKKVSSTHYYHSDSSVPGYVDRTESRFEYDQTGRIVRVRMNRSTIQSTGTHRGDSSVVRYTYKSPYDTLFSVRPAHEPDLSTVTNINRWERNKQGQLERNFRLYVMKRPQDPRLDTFYYYSHRFSYDTFGRRNLAWFDIMYLGMFYTPAGPDTIRYFYDKQNRLTREVHRYTLDKLNKREIDTTSLDKFSRQTAALYRQRVFVGDGEYPPSNERTNIVEYRYESFDPTKHLPLQVSQNID